MSGKTNTGLVDFCKSKIGTPYVYGAKMEVLTTEKYAWLKKTYGSDMVWDSDRDKIGKVCCDCSGLISAYTGVMRGSSQYKAAAKEVFPISTVSKAPIGALVWKEGHIGVYTGLENNAPIYIAEDGSALNCRKSKLPGVFTHWFLCPDIIYDIMPSQTTTPDPSKDDVLKAIDTLAKRGVMQSPEYWKENWSKLPHLGRLIVNMSAKC